MKDTADHIQALLQAFERVSESRAAMRTDYVHFRGDMEPRFPELHQMLEVIDAEQIQLLLTEALHIAQHGEPKEWRFDRYKKKSPTGVRRNRTGRSFDSLKVLMELEDKFHRMPIQEQATFLQHPRLLKYLVDQENSRQSTSG